MNYLFLAFILSTFVCGNVESIVISLPTDVVAFATEYYSNRLRIEWTEPPECQASCGPCSYQINLRKVGETWEVKAWAANPNVKIIQGLRPATYYDVAIKAKSKYNESCENSGWTKTFNTTNKPNIIVIMTDDEDWIYGSGQIAMPNLQTEVAGGINGTNFYASTPLCCPSRAEFLTGQYCHNTKVWDNGAWNSLENSTYLSGGYAKFFQEGLENHTIATVLNDEGYENFMIGKFLNGYNILDNSTETHPGWTHWFASTPLQYYATKMSNNGTGYIIAPENEYQATTYTNYSLEFLKNWRDPNKRFFMFVSHWGPHRDNPSNDCTWDYSKYNDSFENESFPVNPNYNPNDTIMAMKPTWIKEQNPRAAGFYDKANNAYKSRLKCLASVDDFIVDLMAELEAQNMVDSTYLVYVSDNGYHMGEFRMWIGKRQAYESDAHIPFYMWGADITGPKKLENLWGISDLAPTLLRMANVSRDNYPFMDGRDFSSLIFNEENITSPEENYVYTSFDGTGPFEDAESDNNSYRAVRVWRDSEHFDLYVEWCNGETEWYNLSSDPYQLTNLVTVNQTLDFWNSNASLALQARPLSYLIYRIHNCSQEGCTNIEYTTNVPQEYQRQSFQCKLEDAPEAEKRKRSLSKEFYRKIARNQDAA